jgi:hypothetical protein
MLNIEYEGFNYRIESSVHNKLQEEILKFPEELIWLSLLNFLQTRMGLYIKDFIIRILVLIGNRESTKINNHIYWVLNDMDKSFIIEFCRSYKNDYKKDLETELSFLKSLMILRELER